MAGGKDQPPPSAEPEGERNSKDPDGKSIVRGGEIRGEIKALTGLRIVAAVWDIARGRATSSRAMLDRACELE